MCCKLIRISLNSVEIIHKHTMRREPGEIDLGPQWLRKEDYLRKRNTAQITHNKDNERHK